MGIKRQQPDSCLNQEFSAIRKQLRTPYYMLLRSLFLSGNFAQIANDISLRQEDLLEELAPKYGFDYVVVRPMTIIGAVKGNFLNLA
jgi:hypothetical protein